jgi:iron only hydrogenase large subunit-like protein
MPCYDKKLEAVRDDFVFEVEQEDANKNGLRIAEVDSVLTTGEVLDLIKVRLRFPIMAVYVSFVASFFFFSPPLLSSTLINSNW